MAKYYRRMTPQQLMRTLESFVDQINGIDDQELKSAIYQAAHRFAVTEARRNDKFPPQVFMTRLSERTGVHV